MKDVSTGITGLLIGQDVSNCCISIADNLIRDTGVCGSLNSEL